jgi:hypothetical protein
VKQRSVHRCLLSNKDNFLHLIEIILYQTEKGAKGQGSGETERESEGENASVGREGTQRQS